MKHCQLCGADLPDDAPDLSRLFTLAEVRERERAAFIESRQWVARENTAWGIVTKATYKMAIAEAKRRYGGEA